MEKIIKRERINDRFFKCTSYLRTPCAIDIKVVQDDTTEQAAIDKINFGWIEYNNVWSDDEYIQNRNMSIVRRLTNDPFDIAYSVQYAYIWTSNSIDEFKDELFRLKAHGSNRVICWSKDLNELYPFLKHEFKCETFYIDNTDLAVLTLDDFLEIRDIQTFTGDTLGNSLEYCKVPPMLDIPGHVPEKYIDKAITYLLYFGDWYYKNTKGLPITIQQNVSKELKSRMTDEDKALIKAVYPDETAYKLLKKHSYLGAVIAYNMDNQESEDDIGHYDFVSSYSTRILLEKFPMGKMKKVSSFDEVDFYDTYLVEVEFTDLQALHPRRGDVFLTTDCALSLVGEKTIPYMRVKNKLLSAKKARFLLCEVDYTTLHRCYSYSEVNIINIYKAKAGKLPDYVRSYTEELFLKKCTTDGTERTFAKQQLEVIIGSMFRGIYKNRITSWDKVIDSRILSPYWAIWALAYARAEMINFIQLFKEDFIAGHTDACYFSNKSYYEPYINQYNKVMSNRVYEYCMFERCNDDFKYEVVNTLGKFKDEDEDIAHIYVKNANSLVFVNDYDEITTKIGGLPKHFVKDGKLVNVIELNSNENNIFDNFKSRQKWKDYVDKHHDSDKEFDFTINNKRYTGKGYQYKWREFKLLNEDTLAKEVQQSIELADELKNKIGFVR